MCDSIEVVITGVLNKRAGQWGLWLTESDIGGQFELLSYVDHGDVELVKAFLSLRDALMARSTLFSEPNSGG